MAEMRPNQSYDKCPLCRKDMLAWDLVTNDPGFKAHADCVEQMQSKDEASDAVEALAAHAHDEQWSGWLTYMFSKCEENSDGSATIPASWYWRWKYQSVVKYIDLPESMRESDREEARAILRKLDD